MGTGIDDGNGGAAPGAAAAPPVADRPGAAATPPPVGAAVADPASATGMPPPLRGTRWLAGWRWGALVAAVYVASTVLMTWPLPARIGTSTVATTDPVWGIWANRWVQHQLVTDPLHLYDANIFYPLDNTLGYSDAMVINAVLSAPVFWLTGNAILTNGLLTLATFPLAAGGMYLLVRRLAGNRAAAFLAGLAFAFVPFRFAHIRHVHLLGHAWTPWVLVALLVLVERRTWRAAAVFGLLLAVQALTSVYLMFQIALVLGLALLALLAVERRARSPRFLSLLAAGGALAALLVVPIYLPYLTVRDEQGLQRTIYEAEYWKGLPSSHLKPWQSRFWTWTNQDGWRDPRRLPGDGYNDDEDAIFAGGLALAGAALGLVGWRRRRVATALLVPIGAAAFVLSLGPSLGPRAYLPTIEPGIPLPYRWLFEHVSFLQATRVTARFGVVVNLATVALAGLGVAWAWDRLAPRLPGASRGRAATVLTFALALLLLLELRTLPIPTEAIDTSAAAAAPYRWLADQPDGPVMEFPAPAVAPWDRPMARIAVEMMMYWSTIHWKPLVNGYSGFFPKPHLDFLAAFVGDLPRADGTVGRGVSHLGPDTVGLLRDLGVRYAVVHLDWYDPADRPAVEARLAAAADALESGGDFGATRVFRIRPRAEVAAEAGSPVRVRLFAPTRSAPRANWEAAIVLQATGRPALVHFRDPPRLETIWRDDTGREVGRQTREMPHLPGVIGTNAALCSTTVASCQPLADGAGQVILNPTRPNPAPRQPGVYTVELTVSGPIALTCRYEVTVAGEPAPAAGATEYVACEG